MMHRLLSLALLAALLPACDSGGGDGDGDGGDEGPDVDCATATVPKFSEMTAWTKCTNCHSSALTDSARNAAPLGVDFDTVAAARANAQIAMDEVFEGSMPLAGFPQLSDAEKTQIYNWASCDTPE
jgi:uncharacterized membrane protein